MMNFSGKDFNFELGKKTYVMGILNITHNSFFDGGKYNTLEKAILHAKEMAENGAHIIDIGAQSTAPNNEPITAEQELQIIKEYLPTLKNHIDCVISVDTFNPVVAEYALQNGASIINDVSGVFNEKMAFLVKKYNCGWIIMHTGGGDAKTVPHYKTTVTDDIINFFDLSLKKCVDFGISPNQIMLDTGIGFGKNYEQNLEVIRNINKIKRDNVALLTALSNKRVVGTATNTEDYDRIYGTISANALAISGGTDFIRVHNVKEAMLGAKMVDAVVRG